MVNRFLIGPYLFFNIDAALTHTAYVLLLFIVTFSPLPNIFIIVSKVRWLNASFV